VYHKDGKHVNLKNASPADANLRFPFCLSLSLAVENRRDCARVAREMRGYNDDGPGPQRDHSVVPLGVGMAPS
jgi:hypothetical protein